MTATTAKIVTGPNTLLYKNVCQTLKEHSVCGKVALTRLSFSFHYNFNLNYVHH